jgi:MFS family permease
MAGFVLLAVLMRPVGGWLSDRIGPPPVLAATLIVVGAGAVVQSLTPSLVPLGTIAFPSRTPSERPARLGTGAGDGDLSLSRRARERYMVKVRGGSSHAQAEPGRRAGDAAGHA